MIASAWKQEGEAEMEKLLGSWDLVDWYRLAADGSRTPNGGSNPAGRLTYSADGTMHAIIVASGRPSPVDMNISAEDKVKLFETLLAYSGTFRVEAGRVIHRVDVSWNGLWTGQDLIRLFELHDNTLRITTEPSRDLYDGTTNVYVVDWVKTVTKM